MKLELKHIAPYYANDLKVQYFNDERGKMTVCSIAELRKEELTILDNENQYEVLFYEIRPLLIPLSDWDFSPFMVNSPNIPNFIFLTSTEHTKSYHFKDLSKSIVEYCVMQHCFENRLDAFGLIEQGLAIDINTLEQ